MKLENYEVHLPSYSIGNTIYNKIGPVCESYGKTVLVIGGKLALDNIINLRLDITHLYYPAKNSFQKSRLKRREIFTELLLYTLTT